MFKNLFNRSISFLLCLATVLMLAPVCVSGASKSDLVAYVADENTNAYPEKYNEYLNSSSGKGRTWEGFAWRGDEVLSRIDFLTRTNEYKNVNLIAEDFVSSDGKIIESKNISFTYLDSAYIEEKGYSLFDIITDKRSRDMQAKSMYSAWVSVSVPESASAGVYTGELKAVSGTDTVATFTYTLTVYDLVQPEISSTVDLWMWPYNSIRYYSGKTTEEYYGQEVMEDIDWETLYNTHLDKKYFPALESELELYAKAGGDTVFAQVNEYNRTNGDPYPSLVKWIKNTDGTMSFDYTDFDKWVELNFKHGIDKEIKCYAMGVFSNNIVYYDMSKKKVMCFPDSTGGGYWKRYWAMFLDDFIAHLEKKGWFDITYMAMDEKDYKITKAVIDEVKLHKNKKGESLKIATAVATFDCEELFDDIDDLSLAYGMSGGRLVNIVEDRNKKGLITTLYTCGPQGSSMLNDAGQSAESIHTTYKEGTNGFLRWALQKYNANPFETSKNYNEELCAGDCYLIYPSSDNSMKAQSTPRYEKLCEGLRDIEKMRYLENNLTYIKNSVHDDMLETQHATDFRAVINKYSQILSEGEPTFEFAQSTASVISGNTVSFTLGDDALAVVDEQSKQTYIDDANFTFSDGWVFEGQYFWLFLYSTNHYALCGNANSQKSLFYEFDFYGDSFIIKGSKSYDFGMADVYVDGEKVATIDNYKSGSTEFYNSLYSSEKLTLGEHHVKVVGAGNRNSSSSSYRMQVDYAIAKTSASVVFTSLNPDIATVDQSGTVTGVRPGKAIISAKCGEFTASGTVTVRAGKEDLKNIIDKLEKFDISGFGSEGTALTDALEDARTVYDNDSGAEQIADAYDGVAKAYEALIESVRILARPNKVTYFIGEEFSSEGGVMTVKYKDGSEKNIDMSEADIYGFDSSSKGKLRIEAVYSGKSVYFPVSIIEDIDLTEIYSDVIGGAWYYTGIQYAVSNKLFSGMSPTTFEPNTPMTRAMIVRVLYNIEGAPDASKYSNNFADVASNEWYTNAVKWAAANKIVSGMSPTEFSPKSNVTRQDLSLILYKYAQYKGYNVSTSADISAFPDSSEASSYAQKALSWAVGAGLISGNKVGNSVMLDAKGKATRAQVALILKRFCERLA